MTSSKTGRPLGLASLSRGMVTHVQAVIDNPAGGMGRKRNNANKSDVWSDREGDFRVFHIQIRNQRTTLP